MLDAAIDVPLEKEAEREKEDQIMGEEPMEGSVAQTNQE